MTRRTDFQKAITYTGQKIKGPVEISYKIDGVRLLYREDELVTRNNKTPPGLQLACTWQALEKLRHNGDCELYTGKFKDVQGPISQHEPEPNQFTADHVYPLVELDERLFVARFEEGLEKDSPTVQSYLGDAIELGYEGLVLRTPDKWYRVKPKATADVRITGYFEQLDKHKVRKNQLGGFTTNYGNVTAFTEKLRQELWDNPEQHVGKLMEVEYKELYDTGSFRYAVKFIRFRDDKEEESFDTK
jgi:hypothetical protein